MHDRLLSWLDTSTSIKSGGVKLFYWPKPPLLVKKSLEIPRYQRGNHNPYIEEEQTAQWPKEKFPKYNQRSTKHTHKTKNRVTRTPLKTGGELR